MSISEKRLNAIKKITLRNHHKHCFACGRSILPGQKAFRVRRNKLSPDGKVESFYTCHYCLDCMESKSDVLHSIDSDSYREGIFNVDPPSTEGYTGYGMKPKDIKEDVDYSVRIEDFPDFFG